MARTNTVHFDNSNFQQEVLDASGPVLVDFWAEWCGPCRQLTPVIDELASDYAGKVKVGKLNIDNAPQIAGRFGVQSIPTVIVFHKGEPVERLVGLRAKRDYKAILDAKLGVAG